MPVSARALNTLDVPAVFDAHTQANVVCQRLQQQPDALLVVCYCATWCRTCADYRPSFNALAARWPQHVFIWIDIEDSPQLLGDTEVENFPTLLLQGQTSTLFFGVQQPVIAHLEKLLQRSDRLIPVSDAPQLWEMLKQSCRSLHDDPTEAIGFD